MVKWAEENGGPPLETVDRLVRGQISLHIIMCIALLSNMIGATVHYAESEAKNTPVPITSETSGYKPGC